MKKVKSILVSPNFFLYVSAVTENFERKTDLQAKKITCCWLHPWDCRLRESRENIKMIRASALRYTEMGDKIR